MLKKLSIIGVFLVMTVFCGIVCFGDIIVTKEKGKQEELVFPDTASGGVIVVDMATGYTIYEKNIYTAYYPASTTKIMTATLVLENSSLDEIVTFSHDAVFSIESGSSAAFVDEGEKLTVEQCMYGLMVISANDLANGLAEHISGTVDEFSLLMNEKAKELGCVNTHFTNPHGLHNEEHYTCVYDLAIMALNAYKNYDFYREIIGTELYEMPPTNKQSETRYWRNTNKLFNSTEKFYYSDCIGGKPGFTNEAGATLVSYANINGRYIMIATLGAKNATAVYTDHTNIYDYIKENVEDEYFEELEKVYNKNKKILEESESDTVEANNSIDVASNQVNETVGDDGKIGIGKVILTVIVVIVLILVILYTVLRIRLVIKRRKRIKRIMKRRYRRKQNTGNIFHNFENKD